MHLVISHQFFELHSHKSAEFKCKLAREDSFAGILSIFLGCIWAEITQT